MRKELIRTTGLALALCMVFLGLGVVAGTVAADEGAPLESMDGDGTEDNPYSITTVEELQAMNQDLEAHYVLEDDIDASETKTWNGGAGFVPIGDGEYGDRGQTPFTGSFDGQQHTITDLTINRADTDVGLFGGTAGTISDVRIVDAEISSAENRVGILAGEHFGTIERVYTSGSVDGDEQVGGLVARTPDGGTIHQSGSSATVTADEWAGGLIGEHRSDHELTESYAAGDVYASDEDYVGGFAGRHTNTAEVRNSYSRTTVHGGDQAGGFVGVTDAALFSVFATGSVHRDGDSVGGFAGNVWPDGSVSTGYWDTDTTGQTAGAADADIGTGLGTDEMTGSDATASMDLDFDTYWTATDEYPVLQWQVQDVHLRVSQPEIGEGETTSATVELTLEDGSTVTASEVATYDSEAAVADVTDGALEANAVGETELTATVAGETDTTTVTVLEPPNIEFVDAVFDTEAAVEGATIDADATYENTGGPGSETATVTVDGEDVASSSLEIDADGETTESIEWAVETGGTVEIDGDKRGELTVVEPGTVSLESVTLPPEAAAESEYEIDLEFDTEADQAVTDTVELRIGGDVVAEESVTVDAGGSTETITHAHDGQGTTTHVVALHDDEETVTMELLEPAEFSFAELDVPETVSADEMETVTATVTNTGGGEDTAEIVLTADGESIETTTVALESSESETLEFEPTFDEDGEIDIVLESPDDTLEETVTVESDDSIPGFGGAVAVVAIGLVSILALHRR